MMIKIENADLPIHAIARIVPASLLRIFNGTSREFPPLIRFDYLTNYRGVFLDETPISLREPDWVGLLYRISLPFPTQTILGIFGLFRSEPENATAETWWDAGDGTIYVYSNKNPSTLNIAAIATATVPIPNNDIYRINVGNWGIFDATTVDVEGHRFIYSATPGTGEFNAIGNFLELHGGPGIRPAPNSIATVALTATVNAGDAVAAIATFAIEEFELIYYAEYLARVFTPAVNSIKPEQFEFIWTKSRMSLILPLEMKPGLRGRLQQATPTRYNKAIALMTFDRPLAS